MGQWRAFCDAVIYKTLLSKYALTKDNLLDLISVKYLDRDFLLENLPKNSKKRSSANGLQSLKLRK